MWTADAVCRSGERRLHARSEFFRQVLRTLREEDLLRMGVGTGHARKMMLHLPSLVGTVASAQKPLSLDVTGGRGISVADDGRADPCCSEHPARAAGNSSTSVHAELNRWLDS